MSNLKSILEEENLNISTNKKGTDKGDFKSYIDLFYDSEFTKFKNKNIRLLEIGFRHGASLCMWSKYFKEVEILGLDNGSDASVSDENQVVDEWVNRGNVDTAIGDAYDPDFASRIQGEYDIIIDDGPHSLQSQLQAIRLYLPKLKEGGVFVIEDIQRYGWLTVWPFLLATPFKYSVFFHDYRKHKPGDDNILFVIKNELNGSITSWLALITKGLVFSGVELFRYLVRKVKQ